MGGLAKWIHGRARAVVIAAFGCLLVAALLGAPALRELSNSVSNFYDPHGQDAAVSRATAANGGLRASSLVVVVRRAHPAFSAGADHDLEAVAERIAGTEGVSHVYWPPASSRLAVSSDGRYAALVTSVSGDSASVAKRLRQRLRGTGALVGGTETAAQDMGKQASSDATTAELLALPLLIALSLLIFRSPVAALLPSLVSVISVTLTFAVLRGINASAIGLSVYALNLVTGIGFGLALDYALLIVSRYREELHGRGPPEQALERTLRTAGRTVLFSSLTVAVALATLTIIPIPYFRSMGIAGVVVALTSMTVALTVLPATLVLLGSRLEAGSSIFERLRQPPQAQPSRWRRLALWVTRRRVLVATTTVAVLLLMALPLAHARFVSIDYRMLPPGSEDAAVGRLLASRFAASVADPVEVLARAPSGRPADFAAYAARLARGAPGVPALTTRLSGSTWLIDLFPRGEPMGSANRTLVERIRALPSGGLVVLVGGTAAKSLDQRAAIERALPIALVVMAVAMAVVLFIMTRSLLLPLKALLMNAIGACAAIGLLVLIFQDGVLSRLLGFHSVSAVEISQPVLQCAIAFGLATDYGVFLLTRIKEARDGGLDDREAIVEGVDRTGRIITAAATLFCVAIGALATSPLIQIKQLALGTVLAVLIDAFIIRPFLVPSLMAMLARWNWYTPRTLLRLLPAAATAAEK